MIGRTLSHYQILEELGTGGMGTVYRARDTKLGRDVAVKVLREQLASDPDRLRRFEQEARSASALNHPNIVTIYDIGQEDDTPFIVMEYVEGETLRDLLNKGPLSTKEILEIAMQMAEGLAKAHSAGIVHRDLKPENLVVTKDGYVKILDFGLAKLMPEFFASSSDMVTLSKAATKEGAILGTVQYMSPEQAAGQPVDYRSDQFAFGSILYEMATGQRAFERKSGVQILAAIIENEPQPVHEVNPNAPPFLRVTLKRCLAKNPEERYGSTQDLVLELKAVQDVAGLPVASVPEGERQETIDSIAVLPLADLRADPDQEYFADGMTEALITDLAKIKALKVISRTSIMRYKKTEKSLPEIAQELNVAAIVEGSILREGNRVRITAQLIEAETDRHLWADSYDRELESILVLQSEVAQAIAREIQVAVTPDEAKRLASARAVHPEAYQAYLKGHFHWYKQTPEDFDMALEYFELALVKDPDYALAYLGIAKTWMSRSDCGVAPPQEALPKAILAAKRALELDATCAEAYSPLAMIHFAERDWTAAEREIRRAIELNPNSVDAHLFYSDLLMSTGRSADAMSEIERCLELDPLNFFYQCYYGWFFVYLGRNDDAIVQLQKTLKMEPNFAAVHLGLWGAFYQKRQFAEALDEAKAFYELLGDTEIVDVLSAVHGDTGYREAMLLAAENLEARSNHAHVPATRIARMFAHAEENERALEWLEKAYEANESPLVHLRVSWDWHNLRDDPRFNDLLRRVKLGD